MIRRNKPVRLYEWGEGTNTLNQVWSSLGEGRIVSDKSKQGRLTLTVELKSTFDKRNKKDNTIKIMQQGEGMTAQSTFWGEVAMGQLTDTRTGNRVAVIEIPTATKISN